ncbi:hypothetical protein J437_LFUL019241 [Ladona fulva]|uniref:Reverse transcriptase n=1 Tax=Ladona fulva TaxID=123851 RepID=A0A8K0PB25_LADFU|nr:hypothetical protein J437_LFUL019241 [Ladona fulva]
MCLVVRRISGGARVAGLHAGPRGIPAAEEEDRPGVAVVHRAGGAADNYWRKERRGAIPVLERTLKNAARGAYLLTLLRKPDQGKVLLASSSSPSSNHFVDGGRYTRFCDWRFVYRARLDVLPLNACRRWEQGGDRRCRRSGHGDETLPHVLNHCKVHSRAWQLRHDGILDRLATAIRGRLRDRRRFLGLILGSWSHPLLHSRSLLTGPAASRHPAKCAEAAAEVHSPLLRAERSAPPSLIGSRARPWRIRPPAASVAQFGTLALSRGV